MDFKNKITLITSSVAASFGLTGIVSYCASKFAMLGSSEGLKHELKNTCGVTVVSLIMVRTTFLIIHLLIKCLKTIQFQLVLKKLQRQF